MSYHSCKEIMHLLKSDVEHCAPVERTRTLIWPFRHGGRRPPTVCWRSVAAPGERRRKHNVRWSCVIDAQSAWSREWSVSIRRVQQLWHVQRTVSCSGFDWGYLLIPISYILLPVKKYCLKFVSFFLNCTIGYSISFIIIIIIIITDVL